MKIQIRSNVFESNSSSVHSLTMCSGDEYDKWIKGEMLYDRWNDKFVETTEERLNDEDHDFLTYDQFNDYEYIDYETFEDSYTTSNGETVYAIGYYGENR